MLTGFQLTIAIAAILLSAFTLGWFLHWLWIRWSNAAISDTARIAEMVTKLDEAEHARALAEETRELAESLLAEREAEMEASMTTMQTRLDGAIEGREAELTEALREAKIDAEVSMDGLRNARAQVMELEAEIERLKAEG